MSDQITTNGQISAAPPQRTRGQRWTSTVLGVLFLAIMLFPVYWMLNMSLQPGGTVLSGNLIPLQPTLEGYEIAIAEQGGNLVTSIIVALGAVVLSLALSAPAAYALSHFKYRWISVALLILLVAQMIPSIVIANALYAAYNDLGLLNSYIGLILADASLSVPFAILILRAFMMSVNPAIIEAARVDGAGQWRAFLSIVVPVSKNSLITAGLFAFLFAWSDFLFALTLTTTPDVRPITLGIYEYLGTQITNWAAVMATAAIASVPAIVLLLLAQRYIAAGAMGGAVK